MVFFGAPKPSPTRDAVASMVDGRTSPVHVSATSTKKPPVPSAPKPVIPAEEIQLPLAPHALYAALVSPAATSPPTALSSSALDHQVAGPAPLAVVLEPLGAAPVQTAAAVHVAASPADDLALQAVFATTGSPAPSGSQQVAPSPTAPPPGARPRIAPQQVAPPPAAPAASAPASGGEAANSRRRMPCVPPVAGMEFVGAGGGAVRAQYPPLLVADVAAPAIDDPLPFLAGGHPPGRSVLAHGSLLRVLGNTILDGPQVDCLDAADQLAFLPAPVLAAPARGVVAALGQLDAAVRGLRRCLRAGTGVNAIAASTLEVCEVWRNLTGILVAPEADRM
ncbi:unnamed protein product [Closterium sp. Naga37s-1]|nr:unnamed protein product [Closterium sp. Naga37s-1]